MHRRVGDRRLAGRMMAALMTTIPPSAPGRCVLVLAAVLVALVCGAPPGLTAGAGQSIQPLPPWERGTLDIHQINTGTGDAAFFILPDGTTWLLDAGAGHRVEQVRTRYDAPPRPGDSRRPGEWIARYVRRMHPEGDRGELDYAMLTHFHSSTPAEIGLVKAPSNPGFASAATLTVTPVVGVRTDPENVRPVRSPITEDGM